MNTEKELLDDLELPKRKDSKIASVLMFIFSCSFWLVLVMNVLYLLMSRDRTLLNSLLVLCLVLSLLSGGLCLVRKEPKSVYKTLGFLLTGVGVLQIFLWFVYLS